MDGQYLPNMEENPLYHTLSIIGGKWKLPILWLLNRLGTIRYNQLKRSLPGITDMMLAQSLKELQKHRMIDRIVFPEVPPHVEYMLTDDGKSLMPLLEQLSQWGKLQQKKICNLSANRDTDTPDI